MMDVGLIQDSIGVLSKGFLGENINLKRKWFLTKFVLSDKNNIMRVKYKIKNYSHDFDPNKSPFLKYANKFSVYDFSPASYWASGIIYNISISIDVSKLESNFEKHKINSPINFQFENGVYTYKNSDFDPSINRYFSLEYSYNTIGLSEDIIRNKIDSTRILNITPNDKHKFLNDLDFQTFNTFTLTKNNVIQYNFKENTRITDLIILNGDYSNESNFNNFCKIKNRVCFQ